ncbi:MAG: hypothetical protein AAB347_02610, partial [Bacteroidota bacterium]
MILKKADPDAIHQNRCFLIKEGATDSQIPVNEEERFYLIDKLEKEQRLVEINRYSSKLLIVGIPVTKGENATLEAWRRQGNEVAQWAKKEKLQSIEVNSLLDSTEQLIAFAEGVVLGS